MGTLKWRAWPTAEVISTALTRVARPPAAKGAKTPTTPRARVATTRTAAQRAPPLRPQPPLQSPPRVQAPRLGPPRPCPIPPPPPSLRSPPPPKPPPPKRKPPPLPRPPPPWPWTQSPCRGTTQCARKVQLQRQTSKRRQSPTAVLA